MPDIIQNLKIEQIPTPEDKEDEIEVPQYILQLDLSDTERKRIVKEIEAEFNAIKKERDDAGIDKKIEVVNKLYEKGLIEEDEEQQFGVSRHLTKDKVDKVVNRVNQAQLEAQPHHAILPRPDFSGKNGNEVASMQEDFLDYKLDEVIPYRDPTELVNHTCALQGNGIKKFELKLEVERSKRDETYIGEPLYYINDGKTKMRVPKEEAESQIDNPDVRIEYENKGIEEFLSQYPEGREKYPGIIRKLDKGETYSGTFEYDEILYDDPMVKCVDLQNFFVRLSTEGNIGLATTRLIVERETYSWWELKKLSEKPEYYEDEINKLMYANDGDQEKDKKKEGYENEVYVVWNCTYYTTLKDDTKETKNKFWIAEERKAMIGAIRWPYDQLRCEYIDYHMPKKRQGFYQPGLGEYLKDDSITIDAFTNYLLEAMWIANTITPIAKTNSSTYNQWVENRFTMGTVLESDDGKNIRFVNEFIRPPDVNGILSTLAWVNQGSDQKLGINSAAMTGRADPLDPNAPARKTMALMAESNINIKAYIMAMSPSMNADAYALLALYYQVCKKGIKYRKRNRPGKEAVGGDPFAQISREQLVARTNIQSQAYVFAIDKLNETKENFLVMQVLRSEPLVASDPQKVFNLISAWLVRVSQYWKNNADKILGNPAEVQQKIIQTTLQTVKTYVQQANQKAEISGTPPEYNPQELLAMVAQMQKFIATPPNKEEAKQLEGK